jgi:hypothetical protein
LAISGNSADHSCGNACWHHYDALWPKEIEVRNGKLENRRKKSRKLRLPHLGKALELSAAPMRTLNAISDTRGCAFLGLQPPPPDARWKPANGASLYLS